MIKFIAMLILTLVTSKAAAKHELLFNKLVSDMNFFNIKVRLNQFKSVTTFKTKIVIDLLTT